MSAANLPDAGISPPGPNFMFISTSRPLATPIDQISREIKSKHISELAKTTISSKPNRLTDMTELTHIPGWGCLFIVIEIVVGVLLFFAKKGKRKHVSQFDTDIKEAIDDTPTVRKRLRISDQERKDWWKKQ